MWKLVDESGKITLSASGNYELLCEEAKKHKGSKIIPLSHGDVSEAETANAGFGKLPVKNEPIRSEFDDDFNFDGWEEINEI